MKDRPSSSVSTGDWTDANVHDPGITLLEVLVYTAAGLIGVVALIKRRRYRRRSSVTV
jgi:hypothetical protein